MIEAKIITHDTVTNPTAKGGPNATSQPIMYLPTKICVEALLVKARRYVELIKEADIAAAGRPSVLNSSTNLRKCLCSLTIHRDISNHIERAVMDARYGRMSAHQVFKTEIFEKITYGKNELAIGGRNLEEINRLARAVRPVFVLEIE